MSQCLYKENRPSTFDGLIGQSSTSKVLKEQIKHGTFSHAYLFHGLRGTGKTSTARILSNAVNCREPKNGNPCNQCSNCRENASLDIIEIDAATNNSVDQIRDLTDQCKFVPTKMKYKVYIIDEVHMLSTSAFNALLKTLEEPPSHCLLILCTTELHKVPATVKSRCQIYTFREIGVEDIVDHLKTICEAHQITASNDALNIIARNADGSMRDALSILDQFVSLQEEITEVLVNKQLGILNRSIIIHVAESILNKDLKGVMEFYRHIISIGCSVNVFINDLVSVFRDVMLYLSAKDIEVISNTKTYRNNILTISSKATLENIFTIIETLSNIQAVIKNDVSPKIRVEMVLIKLASNTILDKSSPEMINEIVMLRRELDELKENGKIVTVEKSAELIYLTDSSVDINTFFANSSKDNLQPSQVGLTEEDYPEVDSSTDISKAESDEGNDELDSKSQINIEPEELNQEKDDKAESAISDNNDLSNQDDHTCITQPNHEDEYNEEVLIDSTPDLESSEILQDEDSLFGDFNYFEEEPEVEVPISELPVVIDNIWTSITNKINEDPVIATLLNSCKTEYDTYTETYIIQTNIPVVQSTLEQYLHAQQIFSRIGVNYSIRSGE